MENLSVNQRLELAVNQTQSAIARARQGLLGSSMGLDNKRQSAWCEYGYPLDIQFADLYKLYRRNGIANGIITRMVDTCWRDHPYAIQGEKRDDSTSLKPWERRAEHVLNESFWDAFKEADKRRLIGRYSGLIMQINDRKPNEKPEDYWKRAPQKGKELVKLIPVWASALQVDKTNENISSDRYGLPETWAYTPNQQALTAKTIIHHERIIILGDYTIDGMALLEPAYNNFVNLEKIEGGSGEGFLKNSARQIHLGFNEDINLGDLAATYGVTPDQLADKFQQVGIELNRGNDTVLITQGANASVLAASIPDPTPYWQVNMHPVSAASMTPQRIAVGSLTGERASVEDRKIYESGMQARRNSELMRDCRVAVDKLIRIGVLDKVDQYTIIWSDLVEDSVADKLAAGNAMADINVKAAATGDVIFSGDEIRAVTGHDAREVEYGDETDDQDTDTASE